MMKREVIYWIRLLWLPRHCRKCFNFLFKLNQVKTARALGKEQSSSLSNYYFRWNLCALTVCSFHFGHFSVLTQPFYKREARMRMRKILKPSNTKRAWNVIRSAQVKCLSLFCLAVFFLVKYLNFFRRRAQIITRPWINHHLLKTCSHFSHFRCLHFTTLLIILLLFFRDLVISNWKFFMVLRISPTSIYKKLIEMSWIGRDIMTTTTSTAFQLKTKQTMHNCCFSFYALPCMWLSNCINSNQVFLFQIINYLE